jgi:hypothetical protein
LRVDTVKSGKPKRGKRRKSYNRALHVVARMRRTGQTLTAASRDEHIDPRTVRKYLGTELRGPKLKRKVRPTKADRRRRDMLVPTALGTSPVAIRDSKQASQLGRYMAAVGKYLRTGNSDSLDEFRGKYIGGHVLITDLETLGSLAQAGALQLDQIYALPESSS